MSFEIMYFSEKCPLRAWITMDYYATMRNDYVHKQMYPSESRVDWIPKGPPAGTLTIKPKDRCPPKFVTKIEGNAVEEGVKVFFGSLKRTACHSLYYKMNEFFMKIENN